MKLFYMNSFLNDYLKKNREMCSKWHSVTYSEHFANKGLYFPASYVSS